jgi:ATP-dependent DNA helicase RecG
MILRFAKEHGSIRRKDVMELCKLGPNQAKHILKAMVNNGLLKISGKKRWAKYEPAG